MDACRVETERVDRIPPGGLAHSDDPGTGADDRCQQRSVEAVGRVPSPHLDVVQGHHLTGAGKADDRFAGEPMDQVRVPGHRVGEACGWARRKRAGRASLHGGEVGIEGVTSMPGTSRKASTIWFA